MLHVHTSGDTYWFVAPKAKPPPLPDAAPLLPVPNTKPLLWLPKPLPCWDMAPKDGAFWVAKLVNVEPPPPPPLPNPNPPVLAADVPSPNTLPLVEPRGLEKPGAVPNVGAPPKPGDPPKVGGLPNTGAAPNPPVLLGLGNPNPWEATLPPALNVPEDFWSPNVPGPPKLKDLAPLLPNRLLALEEPGEPNAALDEPNGFLFAASWLGFPPRPLKKPPLPAPPLLAPNSPPEDEACPKTLEPVFCDCPNRDPEELGANPADWPKPNGDDDVVVVAEELAPPKAGVL